MEARRRKREEENAQLCKLCIPNPINTKPNSPLIDLLVPALEEKEENKQERKKECTTDYYPQAPYMWPVMKKMLKLSEQFSTRTNPRRKDRQRQDRRGQDSRRQKDLTEITDKDMGEDNLDSD